MRVPDGIARQRLARIVVTGVVGTLASLVVTAARAADAPAQPAWNGRCVAPARSAPADCRMEQRLVAQETGQMLSLAVVEVPGETREPTLQLLLPTGLSLTDGVSLAIDDHEALPLPLQFCDAGGCLARLDVDASLLERMKKGREMVIQATSASGQPLQFKHSLKDFTDSYQAVQ